MKRKILIAWFAAAGMAFPAFGLNGDPDQAKPQAQAQVQVSQATLLLRPDLAMGKIWIVKAGLATAARPPLPVTTLKKGVKYLLYCRYTNAGRSLNGFWKLGYYIDGQMIWNQSWGNVPAGETQTKYIDYVPATTGAHVFACRLDYDKEIAEKDENNNKTQIAFTVVQ
jgi:subtilase family serine protease